MLYKEEPPAQAGGFRVIAFGKLGRRSAISRAFWALLNSVRNVVTLMHFPFSSHASEIHQRHRVSGLDCRRIVEVAKSDCR